jgi:hypothetical protein
MSNSPIPTPRQSQTEIVTGTPDVRTSTPLADTSTLETANLPILIKSDDRTNSMSSHVDENNENEAVCISFHIKDNQVIANKMKFSSI